MLKINSKTTDKAIVAAHTKNGIVDTMAVRQAMARRDALVQKDQAAAENCSLRGTILDVASKATVKALTVVLGRMEAAQKKEAFKARMAAAKKAKATAKKIDTYLHDMQARWAAEGIIHKA